MPDLTAPTLTTLLKLMKVPPDICENVTPWAGSPSASDRDTLVRCVRCLDERRLFTSPCNMEVDGRWLAAVVDAASMTEEALAELEHPGLRAVLEAISCSLRSFFDRWKSYGQPGEPSTTPLGDVEDFFKDLGELRGEMKVLVGVLSEFEPRAIASGLVREGEEETEWVPRKRALPGRSGNEGMR